MNKEDRDLLAQAKDDFTRVQTIESPFRRNWTNDVKFDAGDAYNHNQWPQEIWNVRDDAQAPILTINKTRVHNLQIINDLKMNKPGVTIRPTGNEATNESAQVLGNLIRNIEYHSNAPAAYDRAAAHMVRGGMGIIRITTDYCDPKSFDQEIRISALENPLSCYFDDTAKEPDKSDMKWAILFDRVRKDEVKRKYPKYAKYAPPELFINCDDVWITEDDVVIAEYYYTKEHADTLFGFTNAATGEWQTLFASELPSETAKELEKDPKTRSRPTTRKEIWWCLFVGNNVAEGPKLWPGKYVPIAPMIAEELKIDGYLDRPGHTRAMLDPQRMYNYWASSATEFGALQGKTPWLAPAEAIEEYEELWKTANVINHSVMSYKHRDGDGNEIPAPQKIPAPEQAPLYLAGMDSANKELMMVSGQFEAAMGAPSNERSGKAITERQRMGDKSTYHYIDAEAMTIRHIGRILVDLMPKVYDSQRVMLAQADNGKSYAVTINPQAIQAYEQRKNFDNQVVAHVFNPQVGEYDVQADVGPNYGTQREQAVEALTTLLTQAPALTSLIGDILLRMCDFPGAEEASERLNRMVPPAALGQGPSQQESAMMEQIQKLNEVIGNMVQENAIMQIKLKGKDELRDIEAYDAITKRAKVVFDAAEKKEGETPPKGIEALLKEIVVETMASTVLPILHNTNVTPGGPGPLLRLPVSQEMPGMGQ